MADSSDSSAPLAGVLDCPGEGVFEVVEELFDYCVVCWDYRLGQDEPFW
ncbi:hypothetical protein [Mycobacteroides abscessus]|nr:hypothetical protein [Mycobacteroides abscessus]EIU17455.1 hypothetical protein MA5S0421_0393 [Mycobacteroides abscessus 5S-0421]EIU17849.1 hypothetical protein MA5S0304_0137 [Mycobacteroides abscessus 5S-0304]EIU18822.1 hypothetical protein MA5S0422_1126 [Mycobacteroides abscessus 5S-0422]EIU18859.1 hypothetical protein MA5S0817_5440 [Mycobacteroides abscessus 5S-0817]EIU26490.1 hypothetical protein MA5S0708_2205 [Mycobacteroides abscessus 5S-0708]